MRVAQRTARRGWSPGFAPSSSSENTARDAVADVLVHVAAEADDDRRHRPHILVQLLDQELGAFFFADTFGVGGEPSDVGEQDGDGFALAA